MDFPYWSCVPPDGHEQQTRYKKELAKETNDLSNLIALFRTDVDYLLLLKVLNTLMVLDVQARDIVDNFVRDSIMAAKGSN